MRTQPVFPQSLPPAFNFQRLQDFLSQNLYPSYLIAANGATRHDETVAGITTRLASLMVSFSKLKAKTPPDALRVGEPITLHLV